MRIQNVTVGGIWVSYAVANETNFLKRRMEAMFLHKAINEDTFGIPQL